MHTQFTKLINMDIWERLASIDRSLREFYEENYKSNKEICNENKDLFKEYLNKLSWVVFDLTEFKDAQDKIIQEHDDCYRCLLGLLATIKHEITNLGNRFRREQLDVKESFAATLLLIDLIEKVYGLNKD